MKLALVGCGNIASYHVQASNSTGRVEITTLIDPNCHARENIAKLIPHDVECFSCLSDALAAEQENELQIFDAVSILVPSWRSPDGEDLHEVVASEALRARKHVLLEKPVTVSIEVRNLCGPSL